MTTTRIGLISTRNKWSYFTNTAVTGDPGWAAPTSAACPESCNKLSTFKATGSDSLEVTIFWSFKPFFVGSVFLPIVFSDLKKLYRVIFAWQIRSCFGKTYKIEGKRLGSVLPHKAQSIGTKSRSNTFQQQRPHQTMPNPFALPWSIHYFCDAFKELSIKRIVQNHDKLMCHLPKWWCDVGTALNQA